MTKDEQITYLSSALISIRDEYYPYHGEDAVAIRDFVSETILTWQTKSASQQAVQADAQRCGNCGEPLVTYCKNCFNSGAKNRTA